MQSRATVYGAKATQRNNLLMALIALVNSICSLITHNYLSNGLIFEPVQ